MKKLLLVLAVGLLLVIGGVVHADILLNLPANQYGAYALGHPTYALPLSAGDWQISLVSPATHPQAVYWAWQPWGGSPNWHTACHIFDGTSGHILGMHNATSTAQEAFWQTVNSGNGKITLHLAAASTVRLGVSDSVIVDNGGGLSLLVTAVPEPSSIMILAGGLAGLCGFVVRRRK